MSSPSPESGLGTKMPTYVYGISIGQFLIGAAITVLNSILWLAVAVNPRLRTAPQILLANIWFANLLLGIIVTVSNVVDDSSTYVFRKTEGTVAIVDGFANTAMLLALVTDRVIAVRNPNRTMSTTTAYKIIIATWASILFLTLIKTVLFGLTQIGTAGACFDCFLIFEVTTLVVATVATVLIFFVSLYMIYSYRSRTVGDSSTTTDPSVTAVNHQKEYQLTLTVGLLLLGFSVTFLAFVILIAVYLGNSTVLDAGAAEVVITIFYTHCLINPIIVLVRDMEVRSSARRVARCQRPSTVEPRDQIATVGQTGLTMGGLQNQGLGRTNFVNGIDRMQNDPSAPPFELPPVETTPRSDGKRSSSGDSDGTGKPKYGSTEKVIIHDDIPPPIGGVAFMNG